MRLIIAAVALLAAVALSGCASAAAAEPGREVTITFRYSRFTPAAITVPAGVPVTVTLRNDDPIGHEWIIGTPALHAGHRVGTEPSHEGRASEVTVPPFTTRITTIMFEPGSYAFVCHLPGHEAYGMKGTLTVQAR